MFTDSDNKYLKQEKSQMSKKQKSKYENDLDKMSDLTLELLEQYMTMADFDDPLTAGGMDDLLWGSNILSGDESDNEKSYEDWLRQYGMEDDEDD